MCGRYTLYGNPDRIEKRFGVRSVPREFKPSYNITPGMMMPVFTGNDMAVLARWGLIPFWAKEPSIGYRMINARSESITEKPAFKKPFSSQRCLIPASGFYEWMLQDKEKIPYYIKLKESDIFAFAGLYDIWKDAESRDLMTFTIITTEPNELLSRIHNRMPVILEPDTEKKWLDSESKLSDLIQLLKPLSSKMMETYPVSKGVNNPENDDETLLKPQIIQTTARLL